MIKLSDYASDVFSQFGEDGIVEHIFDVIGTTGKECVEFGGGDGLSCSSTARLWRDLGWRGLLVEPDPEKFEALEGNAGPFNTEVRRKFITPEGPDSIGKLTDNIGMENVDYMSIDVDGNDYAIFGKLFRYPRVICIEFNPTIPPHIEMYQTRIGDNFGASLLALINLGRRKGYSFIGATYCNAFFVHESLADKFANYETDPSAFFSPSDYTYAVTDFAGRLVLVGQPMPWGTRDPYVGEVAASEVVTPPTDNPIQMRRGFESVWGPSLLLTPHGVSAEQFRFILAEEPNLVCVDLSSGASPEMFIVEAKIRGYTPLQSGSVLGLIKEYNA